MKKLLLLFTAIILTSCSVDEEMQTTSQTATEQYFVKFQNWQSPITRVDIELLDAQGNILDYQTYTNVESVQPNYTDAITYSITQGTHFRITVTDEDNSQTGGGNQFFMLFYQIKDNNTGKVYDSVIAGEWYKTITLDLENLLWE